MRQQAAALEDGKAVLPPFAHHHGQDGRRHRADDPLCLKPCGVFFPEQKAFWPLTGRSPGCSDTSMAKVAAGSSNINNPKPRLPKRTYTSKKRLSKPCEVA